MGPFHKSWDTHHRKTTPRMSLPSLLHDNISCMTTATTFHLFDCFARLPQRIYLLSTVCTTLVQYLHIAHPTEVMGTAGGCTTRRGVAGGCTTRRGVAGCCTTRGDVGCCCTPRCSGRSLYPRVGGTTAYHAIAEACFCVHGLDLREMSYCVIV